MTVRELMEELIKQDMDFEVKVTDSTFRSSIGVLLVETNRDEEEVNLGIDIMPNEINLNALGFEKGDLR